MALTVLQQDSIDLSFLDESFQLFDDTMTGQELEINFDDIARVSNSYPHYDNTKLLEDNGVSVDLPPAPCAVTVTLEPPSPSVNLAAPPCAGVEEPASPNANLAQVQELQPLTPEMFLMQPASPGTSIESVLSPYSSQTHSPDPEPEYLQPVASPSLEPVNPGQQYTVVWSSDPVLVESLPRASASGEPVLLPYAVQVKEEAASPVQTFANADDAPKKRGRKRKYPEGTAPRRIRPKKTKVYEMGPLQDEEEEKKRKNAVNAKLHRDKQKHEREFLAKQLEAVTAERDNLLKQVQDLKRSEAQLRQKLAQNVLL